MTCKYSYENLRKMCDQREKFCVNSSVKENLFLLADEANTYYSEYFLRYNHLKSADNTLRQLGQGLTYLERSLIQTLCDELALNGNLENYDWNYLHTELKRLKIKNKDLMKALKKCYTWTQEHVGETSESLVQPFDASYKKIISRKNRAKKVYSRSFAKIYNVSFRKLIYSYIKCERNIADVILSYYMADASVALRSRIDYYKEGTKGKTVYFNKCCKEELDNVVSKNNRIIDMYLYDSRQGYYVIKKKVKTFQKQLRNSNIKQQIDFSKVLIVGK